jgi:hypothetical protein
MFWPVSAPTAKFLMELLEAEESAVEALEIQLACNGELTSPQRETLRMLQGGSMFRLHMLRAAIREHQ